ncbi:ABC transporter permease [Paenibacillus chartarius]|uniref:Transport permease protein n=1 Tax=Paenibacillus chartarius TaxID=747481 RepID=A0ABV6DKU4_9BACL
MIKRNIALFWNNRELIAQLTKREISSRYRGSYLGIVWSFIIPIVMMVIYTFVFSVIFKAKWENQTTGQLEFALLLFSGIIAYNIFSEIVSRAPTLILNNSNYVKKVVFPLEIISIVSVLSALFHFLINAVILLLSLMLIQHSLHVTVVFLPLVILPLILLSLGLSWFFSALGVYIRDINHIIGLALQALMFLSPIFYSISSIPNKGIQTLYYLNPISYVVEDMRKIMVWGQLPDWNFFIIGLFISLVICLGGLMWFKKTRKGFADVL